MLLWNNNNRPWILEKWHGMMRLNFLKCINAKANAIYCKHRKDNAHIVNKDLWHGSRIHFLGFHVIETWLGWRTLRSRQARTGQFVTTHYEIGVYYHFHLSSCICLQYPEIKLIQQIYTISKVISFLNPLKVFFQH